MIASWKCATSDLDEPLFDRLSLLRSEYRGHEFVDLDAVVDRRLFRWASRAQNRGILILRSATSTFLRPIGSARSTPTDRTARAVSSREGTAAMAASRSNRSESLDEIRRERRRLRQELHVSSVVARQSRSGQTTDRSGK